MQYVSYGRILYRYENAQCKTGTGLYENAKFDTPTLREVWRTAPYLSNGKAPTIFDMLKQNKDNAHGETSQLSDSELRDLEIFVLSL